MLTYLAVRGEARRDELIELLWGGMPDAKARNAFRQALHRLRLALGEAMIPQDRDSVRIGTPDLVAIDRNDFLAACESDGAAQAITLYRGDFLEGFEVGESSFDRWCDGERTRLRSRFETVLREGATRKLQGGEWVEALQMAERLAVLAPFDGTAAELEATVLVAAGRPNEALGTLGRYVTRIKEELDIPPTPSVREFLARLERSAGKSGGAASAARDAKPNRTRIPFVGREAELTRLVALVRELERESGSCVVVRGETGIGKTRLVDELLERVQPLGPLLVLRGRERAGGAAIPYAGVADALRPIVHAPGVAGTSRHLLSEAARILPEFRDAFKLDPPDSIEQEGGRLRFFEGMAAVLDAAAYETPVLVVLDDLQHTSASTLDLLTYLAGRLEHSPVLFVLVYRSDGASPQVQERLDALSHARSADSADEPAGGLIDLAPLSTSEIESLVTGYAALRGADPRIDAARIAQSAGGRPMRALDLARRALQGSLGSDSPVRPRDILWARLQSASPSQRRVFLAAALLERSATLRLLAAAAHLPESAALDAAAELERAGLLSQFGSGFGLTHDATAGFVVEVSGVAGRALLAGWAADALAEEGDGTDAELAHLYSLAGRTMPAFRHARVAAYAAAAAGATSEALRLFGVAHTFAPDAAARIEIDDALRTFGDGQRRMLPAGGGNPVDLPLAGTDTSDPTVEPALAHRDPTPEIDGSSRQQIPVDGADVAASAVAEVGAGVGRESGASRAKAAPALRPVFWLALLFATVMASFAIRRQLQRVQPARVLVDSLLVVERSHDRDSVAQVVTGPQFRGTTVFRGSARRIREPAWADSAAIPWINPNPSPNGVRVAEERVSGRGTDLYIMGPGRQDTAVVALGGGQNVALGWSPDSRWLLVSRARTLPDGTFDSDLFRYGVEERTLLPIDTSADRSVSEAVWAPDGLHVAWVASVGSRHQRDIFVSDPDGSDLRHVVDSPAEDYGIAWSPDATLL
ncbi:MAG TPA: AAA family ATPase, partial [Gemmatimonadaceae bacterium]|nr:AAA family ATPase [Gemmatimonadaceae bacterium]